jgi:hypothetical protein
VSTIYDEFRRQQRELIRNFLEPAAVVFNPEGYLKSRTEVDAHISWNAGGPGKPFVTYCGLPWSRDNGQEALILVKPKESK